MDYEKQIEELANIVNQLENEKLTLSDSVKLFERAEQIYKQCNDYLENAKGSVYKIRQDLDAYREEKMK